MTIKLNRRQMIAALSATTAAVGLAGSAFGQERAVRIGTSSVGSVFYTLALGAGEIVGEYAGINSTIEPVGGSAANINGLAQHNVDLAVADSFAAFSGLTGQYGFPQPVDVRLLVQGQPSHCWMFVRPGAGIETPADLNGRTIIGARRALPQLRLLLDAMINHFGLDEASMNIVETNETIGAIEAIRAGSVDAVILPFSSRAGQIEEPMRDGAMQLLNISPEDRDALLELLPDVFYGVDLPENDFSNQPEIVPVTTLNTLLVSHANLDEETAYQITKALLENNEAFLSYHNAAQHWTIENTLGPSAIPFHPGAIRFFTEAGAWSEDMARQQEELLGN